MAKIKAVLIHGTFGDPEENWFPWLSNELQAQEIEVQCPRFPTPEEQTPKRWMEVFKREVGTLHDNMFLVGHSLGAAFILHLLEHSASHAKACFLVSGFIGELGQPTFDPINSPFFEKPFDWKQIKRNAGKVWMFQGSNDPYVPMVKARELASKLHADLRIIKDGGHLNAGAGFSVFPELRDRILAAVLNSGR